MKTSRRQLNTGFTMFELMVVIGVIAAMITLAIPSVRMMRKSYESTGTESMIDAALATARAIAAKEHRYAGVRFQQVWDYNEYPTSPALNRRDVFKVSQYMIFIVQDQQMPRITGAYKAYPGLKPIKLPDNIGVMDLRTRDNGTVPISRDVDIDHTYEVWDTVTFSVIFSPAGKLITTDVRVLNKDGRRDASISTYPETIAESDDDVFNTKAKIFNQDPRYRHGMFLQDDYPGNGIGPEQSRNSFVLYDKKRMYDLNPDRRWTDYLEEHSRSHTYHISPYTGTLIEKFDY